MKSGVIRNISLNGGNFRMNNRVPDEVLKEIFLKRKEGREDN